MDWRSNIKSMSKRLPPFDDLIRKEAEHWYWLGTTDAYGYGMYGRVRAHRLSYEKHVGSIPAGMVVRHGCDQPPCVRPECLVAGTPAQNSADMKARGRQARGETHSQVKLTEAAVRRIRKMLAYGFKQSFIAGSVGISQTTICDIKRGKSWGWFS